MLIKLTDEFLDKYCIQEASSYNDNYYKLPFTINCDGNDYNILRIYYNEVANEYNYSICCDDDNYFIDDRYIVPSCATDVYEIDLNNYSKDYIWT